ncbi:regulator of protease activity HflC (stomatin/prohibitin superfamily) [Streptomyces sp. Amel2xB2]|uniref:slipin family protein n=1 Tax=Streptomyces sp. Amel2xB2 TaxID=1305829 RepID=UPI000DBA5083|nr:slipin family protein [Streptomyces sp. Amel2xB2]RAJ71349.1 regulator of protease activity HflC (stomatin/prohibitin superfamily) [Streptomyces sp. Amel2xB2]
MVVEVIIGIVLALLVYAMAAARVVRQYERGLVFRLGRLQSGVKEPGFTMIVPGIDRLQKVNMQIITLPVPAQEGITRDNVTVRVDAVVYFKVVHPADAIVRVEDYRFAVSQMAQTSLRSIIGKSELDDLLSNREKLNQGLELMIDSPAVEWGVTVDRVEIKDVSLPETMKRSMARQAEAQRDRRARVINADAELEASKKLAQAAEQMSETPSALQLRLLQTVASVATEKNSTLVLPFPVELLRFLEGPREGAAQDGGKAPKSGKSGTGKKDKSLKGGTGQSTKSLPEGAGSGAGAAVPPDASLPPEAAVPEGPAPGAIQPDDLPDDLLGQESAGDSGTAGDTAGERSAEGPDEGAAEAEAAAPEEEELPKSRRRRRR